MALDGENDGRPDRRARRPRRAVPDTGDPPRAAGRARRTSRVEGVPEEPYAALAGRYGHAAHEVLALAAERGELAQPICPACPTCSQRRSLAARREQAHSVGDVLLRRTRLRLLAARELTAAPRHGAGARADRVGDVLARELGWDAARLQSELAGLRARGARGGHRRTARAPDRRAARRPRSEQRGRVSAPPVHRRARRGATLELGGRPSVDGHRQRDAGQVLGRRPARRRASRGSRSRASCPPPAPS